MNHAPEHIDAIIAKSLRERLSATESNVLTDWIEASEEHRHYYEKMVHTSALTAAPTFNVEKAWDKLNIPEVSEKRAFDWKFALRIAALVAVVFTLGYYSFFYDSVMTKIDTHDTILAQTLDDGSEVTLQNESSITYKETNVLREVQMEGEVYFDVAHQPEKPFVIHTKKGLNVTVLGTSFNVNAKSNDTLRVSVSEGKVRLTSIEGDSLILNASEEGIYIVSTGEAIKVALNPNTIAWKTKKLVFEEASFKEVIEVLNYFYNVQIEAPADVMQSCHLTATFDNETIEVVMSVLSASHGMSYERNGEHIQLKGDACE